MRRRNSFHFPFIRIFLVYLLADTINNVFPPKQIYQQDLIEFLGKTDKKAESTFVGRYGSYHQDEHSFIIGQELKQKELLSNNVLEGKMYEELQENKGISLIKGTITDSTVQFEKTNLHKDGTLHQKVFTFKGKSLDGKYYEGKWAYDGHFLGDIGSIEGKFNLFRKKND